MFEAMDCERDLPKDTRSNISDVRDTDRRILTAFKDRDGESLVEASDGALESSRDVCLAEPATEDLPLCTSDIVVSDVVLGLVNLGFRGFLSDGAGIKFAGIGCPNTFRWNDAESSGCLGTKLTDEPIYVETTGKAYCTRMISSQNVRHQSTSSDVFGMLLLAWVKLMPSSKTACRTPMRSIINSTAVPGSSVGL
jgi:hypothetical protein